MDININVTALISEVSPSINLSALHEELHSAINNFIARQKIGEVTDFHLDITKSPL